MPGLGDETAFTANWTGQGVTQVRIKYKLSLPHLAATVVGKAGDAGEMPARKHHHWLLDPCAGKAGHLGRRVVSKLVLTIDPDDQHLFQV